MHTRLPERAAGAASTSERTERLFALRPPADLRDAVAGIDWFNSLSRADRAHWLERAGSAVPADAWSASKRSQEVQS